MYILKTLHDQNTILSVEDLLEDLPQDLPELCSRYMNHSDWRRLQGMDVRSRGACNVAETVLSFSP